MYSVIDDTPEFLLISKFVGVGFHKGSAQEGLPGIIRRELRCSDLYPLHRLDSVTSGLILFAKTHASAGKLAAHFREHQIDKFYLALAGTHPLKKQGTIKGDMIKGRSGSWILSRSNENPAITQFLSTGLGNGLRLYILKPRTGKSHQVRVALKSLGVPVFGDPLYGKKHDCRFIADRAYLHSFGIGFELDGKEYRYVNPPEEGDYFRAEEFKKSVEKYADPWVLPWPRFPAP